MHKLLLPLALLAAGPALAQSTPRPAPGLAADAAAQPGPYCTISGYTTRNSLSNMRFELDYGDNAPKSPENQLFIEQQKIEGFHNAADVLNYMAARGWDLSSTIASPTSGLYFFILRKRPTP